jgi:hypothetical protein
MPLRLIPSHRSFQGLALNQTSASEDHQAEQEFQEQPSDGKKTTHVQNQQWCHSRQALNQVEWTSTPHDSLHLGDLQSPTCTLRLGG